MKVLKMEMCKFVRAVIKPVTKPVAALVLCLLAPCFFIAAPAAAQTSLGAIAGEVSTTDKTLVANADITLTNIETGEVSRTHTGASGAFEFPALNPGTYTLKVSKAGFSQYETPGIQVETGITVSINPKLKVGEVSTVVEVQANTQLLNLDNATINNTVDKETIVELPYPERSALEIATLAPGVNGDPQYAGGVQSENPGVTTQPNTPGASISIAGGRPGTVSQLVDGFDITLSGYPRAGVTFGRDTIHSITVQQAFLPAQYGRNGGGIINQATLAGTSQYHGILYWRHEDPFLEARTQGVVSNPNTHQNLFTFLVSGPVPGTRRRPTFFLGAYEPIWSSAKTQTRRRVASPDELAGRFHNSSDLLDGTILKNCGYLTTATCTGAVDSPRVNGIYNQFVTDPATGLPSATRLGSASLYTHYANDDISSVIALNSVAQYVNGLQPSTNTPYLTFLSPDGSFYDNAGNNAIGVRAVRNYDGRYTGRIDHQLNALNNMFVRYTVVPVSGHRYDYLGPDSIADQIPTDNIISRNIGIGLISVLGSNKVNEARASYLRSNRYRGPADQTLDKDYGAALGLVPATSGVGFPTFGFGNALSSIGSGGTETDGGRSLDINFGLGDDFSWQLGRHSLKFGLDYRALQLNRVDDSATHGGQYAFNASVSGSTLTNTPNPACVTSAACSSASGVAVGSGSLLASFDEGFISTYTFRVATPFYYRWKYGASYVQDDWRILPKLTINLGLRYQVETPRMEKYGLQGVFVPDLTGVNPAVSGGGAVTGGFAFSGTNGLGNTLWPIFYKGFEPRVGFAYAITPTITMHAGYSLIHTPLTGISNSVLPDLAGASSTPGGTTGGVKPGYVNYKTNPIASIAAPQVYQPSSTPLFAFAAQNSSAATGSTISGTLPFVDQTTTVPYVQTYSATVQWQFSRRSLFEVAYVGSRGIHLFGPPTDYNVAPLSTLIPLIQAHCNFNTATTAPQTANVFRNSGQPACNVPIHSYNTGSQTLIQYARPYPQFYNNVIVHDFQRDTYSHYNSLYLRGTERLGRQLTLLASFTWQKSQDNSSNGSVDGTVTDSYGFAYPQEPYDLNGEYSLSTYDQPVTVKTAYVYRFPFGEGHLRNQHNWVNAIIGGFTTTGQVRTSSGVPLHVQESSQGFFVSQGGGNGAQDLNLRPNLVPGQPLIKPNWRQDPFGFAGIGYLNPLAFSVPGSVDNPMFGNTQRNLGGARTPRVIQFDATLRKSFVYEKYTLQFSADAINALNHPNFFQNTSLSAHSIGNSAFGNLGGASAGRVIALGAELKF